MKKPSPAVVGSCVVGEGIARVPIWAAVGSWGVDVEIGSGDSRPTLLTGAGSGGGGRRGTLASPASSFPLLLSGFLVSGLGLEVARQ